MALAKQSTPPVSVGSFRSAQLPWRLLAPAMLLSAFCFAIAFFYFFWRDRRDVNVMVNEQRAPSLVQKEGAAASKASPQPAVDSPSANQEKPLTLGAAASTNPAQTGFVLSKSNQGVLLGSLRVRIPRIDASQHSYDMDVMVGSHFIAHRNLKVGQPLWIAANRGKGSVEIVANSVERDAVSGYWTPSSRLAHITPHRHSRRR